MTLLEGLQQLMPLELPLIPLFIHQSTRATNNVFPTGMPQTGENAELPAPKPNILPTKQKGQLISLWVKHLVDKDIVNQVGPEANVHLKQLKEVADVIFLKKNNMVCNFKKGNSKHAISNTFNYKQASCPHFVINYLFVIPI